MLQKVFSSVYSAFWMEGPRLAWDNTAQEWTRTGPIKVALKRLDDSQNISSSYIDQVIFYNHNLNCNNEDHHMSRIANLTFIFYISNRLNSIINVYNRLHWLK